MKNDRKKKKKQEKSNHFFKCSFVLCRTVKSVWKQPKCSSVRGEVQSVDVPWGKSPPPSWYLPPPQELIKGSTRAPPQPRSPAGPRGLLITWYFHHPPIYSASSPSGQGMFLPRHPEICWVSGLCWVWGLQWWVKQT